MNIKLKRGSTKSLSSYTGRTDNRKYQWFKLNEDLPMYQIVQSFSQNEYCDSQIVDEKDIGKTISFVFDFAGSVKLS